MGSDHSVEVEHRNDAEQASGEIDCGKGKIFSDESAEEDAQTQSHIPGGEIGARGGGTLVVGAQIDVERIVGREDDAEADSLEKRDDKEQNFSIMAVPFHQRLAGGEEEKGGDYGVESVVDALRDISLVHVFACKYTRNPHTDGHQGEIDARGDVQLDIADVHCHIVGGGAVGNGKQEEGETGTESVDEDETVEREGRSFGLWFAGCLDARCKQQSEETGAQGDGEYPFVTDGAVKEESHHRSDAHGCIVRQSVVTQSFAPSFGGHDVDDEGVSAYRDHPEGEAVEETQEDEEYQETAGDVSQKEQAEGAVGNEIEGLALEGVEYVTGEGTYNEGCNGVDTEYGANHALSLSIDFLQIEG